MSDKKFTFDISLSVLNHLGRNLYRSFATVLGEAISNAWDADANKVHIYIDKERNRFYIKDDGTGMTEDDFQYKFLKIGYSKRKGGNESSNKRPFIGRKGIGKLALLSCAEKITVISKVEGGEYVGGKIDNSGLDRAITEDLSPQHYPLEPYSLEVFGDLIADHKCGTIIYFENIHEGIKNNLDFMKKIIALYFRFSLLDESFSVYINDEEITIESLRDLISRTEFLWTINTMSDPFIQELNKTVKATKTLPVEGNIHGFIASVEKPRDLTILTMGERVSVDLFVNGRLRERDLLKHIPTARLAESYLYGQIHFNELDDELDRFTSNRESIKADDPKFVAILTSLKDKVVAKILKAWDDLRRKRGEDGDPDNTTISKKERKSEELFNAVAKEYSLSKGAPNKDKVDQWVQDLSEDARFNFASYAECFVSENLIRKFIQEKKVPLTVEANAEIEQWKRREAESKSKGNVSIDIRRANVDLSYLSMDGLSNLVDKKDPMKEACLIRDAREYKPVRDALAHTALLTNDAKERLTTIYKNIKSRVDTLLKTP